MKTIKRLLNPYKEALVELNSTQRILFIINISFMGLIALLYCLTHALKNDTLSLVFIGCAIIALIVNQLLSIFSANLKNSRAFGELLIFLFIGLSTLVIGICALCVFNDPFSFVSINQSFATIAYAIYVPVVVLTTFLVYLF